MPKPPPESTKVNLRQRLSSHAEKRWPALTALNVRYHGVFAYIHGQLPDGTTMPLCRLRYNGSAHIWGFAIYLASRDGYQDSVLPSGYPVGTPTDLYQATKSQRFRVTATLPYSSFRWTTAALFAVTSLTTSCDWFSMVDDPFTVNANTPGWSPVP